VTHLIDLVEMLAPWVGTWGGGSNSDDIGDRGSTFQLLHDPSTGLLFSPTEDGDIEPVGWETTSQGGEATSRLSTPLVVGYNYVRSASCFELQFVESPNRPLFPVQAGR
jgi:hypothetical protein